MDATNKSVDALPDCAVLNITQVINLTGLSRDTLVRLQPSESRTAARSIKQASIWIPVRRASSLACRAHGERRRLKSETPPLGEGGASI
jgi:hypothetical protein